MRREIGLLITIFFVSTLILKSEYEKDPASDSLRPPTSSDPGSVQKDKGFEKALKELYTAFSSSGLVPSYEVFSLGISGLNKLSEKGIVKKSEVITIVDMSLASAQPRLWVLDIRNKKVLFNSLVAHGKNSGKHYARSFSNISESLQTSLGFYLTGSLYYGKHGLSLILEGLEKNFNDRARERAIVMHGAKYVDPAIARSQGRIGRSFGCPAIPQKLVKKMLPEIAEGSCLFIYYPHKDYLEKSPVLQAAGLLPNSLVDFQR